jgi:hypothetical protein
MTDMLKKYWNDATPDVVASTAAVWNDLRRVFSSVPLDNSNIPTEQRPDR